MVDINNLTPIQQEVYGVAKILRGYTEPIEANICGCFYKEPELLYGFSNLSIEDFLHNVWKVYFSIIKDLVLNEKKTFIDEYTISFYLEQHPKLKVEYEKYGGYNIIDKIKEYVNVANLEGYIIDLNKWSAVYELNKQKYPIREKLSSYADWTLEDIYTDLEVRLTNVILNKDAGMDKVYDISDGIDDMIESAKRGEEMGLELLNMPMLNRATGGMRMGDLEMITAITNEGKSTIMRILWIPTLLLMEERVICVLNEEGKDKVQRDLLIWYINNVIKDGDIDKYTFKSGKWTKKQIEDIEKAKIWLKSMKDKKLLTIIPLKRYNVDSMIKIINKYSMLGVKYFILDTFKMSTGGNTNNYRIELINDSVKLYDVCKEAGQNVHLLCTFQSNKGSARQKYLSIDNLAEAKSVVDVFSTCIMFRKVRNDEKSCGSNPLKVRRIEIDANGIAHQVLVELDERKSYIIFFVSKSREGDKNQQIIAEVDFGKNKIVELGYTYIDMD